MTTTDVPVCPQCASDLVRPAEQPVWCPRCEWNLENRVWTGRKQPGRAARRARLRAFRINHALLAELSGVRPDVPVRTNTHRTVLAISAALTAVDLALLAVGVWLILFVTWVLKLVGVLLVGIAIECRVRVGRYDGAGEVSRADVPKLYELVDHAADALGAPHVDHLIVDDHFNASCGRIGLRGTTVLSIGLPLWGSLSPEGRLALLGHELGHLVNGDPSTGRLTQPALRTFRTIADVFDPTESRTYLAGGLRYAERGPGGGVGSALDVLNWLTKPISYVLLTPLWLAARGVQRRLDALVLADHQRAEVFADALAVRLGGTRGARELARTLVFTKDVEFAIRTAARTGAENPHDWHEAAARALADREKDLARQVQRSLRHDVSAFGTHPPAGLRVRLIDSWPASNATAAVDAAQMSAVDAELRRRYASVRRQLLNTRLS